MNKDDIISLPNTHLRKPSQTINEITEEVLNIIEDMKSATISWDQSREHEVGVALAAVQIDRLYRIVIIRTDYEDKNNTDFDIFINPEVVKLYGNIIEDFEGCLSVPNVYGKVPRYDKVKVKALDVNGNEISTIATGFLARIFQHEIDHTEGKVFVDRIKEMQKAFYRLNESGKLEELDYESEIEKNSILW